MMQHDSAALRVLYIGGTGTISSSCVRLSVESGMSVSVLNRGNNSADRQHAGGRQLADGRRDRRRAHCSRQSATSSSTRSSTSCPTTRTTCAGWWASSAPGPSSTCTSAPAPSTRSRCSRSPISESTPIAPNAVLEYATAKWRAELALQRALAEEGFPVTIVRPSHTYDDANPPLPGAWTVVDRIARGAEIPVHGDGTSLVDADPRRGLRPRPGRPARQPPDDRRGLQHHRRRRLHLGSDLHDRRRRARCRGEAGPCRVRAVPRRGPRLVLVRRDARRHRPQRRLRHRPRSGDSCPASRRSSPSTGRPCG